tara:strand:+ start:958 stop:1635 length:678 start_codon:yes stop_codon:yes gene_type:complete
MNDPTPALNAALAKAQAELQHAIKDRTNPAFKSQYADLASVLDAVRPLAAHGIAVTHYMAPQPDPRVVSLHTVLRHSSGEQLDCGAVCMTAKDSGPQSVASAITYARRYGIMLACGIAPGDNSDDDGNAAQGLAPSKPTSSPERVAAPAQVVLPSFHRSWPEDRDAYHARLKELEVTPGDAELVCQLMKRPLPHLLDHPSRTKFLTFLSTDKGQLALLTIEATKE